MPTSPATRVSTPDLTALHDGRDNYKHHLVAFFQRHNVSSSMFLVASLLTAPQYTVCCTETHSLETKVDITAAASVT